MFQFFCFWFFTHTDLYLCVIFVRSLALYVVYSMGTLLFGCHGYLYLCDMFFNFNFQFSF